MMAGGNKRPTSDCLLTHDISKIASLFWVPCLHHCDSNALQGWLLAAVGCIGMRHLPHTGCRIIHNTRKLLLFFAFLTSIIATRTLSTATGN